MIKYRRDLHQAITVTGDAAEIGVAEGFFSAEILAWPVKFPIVYMVDRWKHTPGQKGDASSPQEWHNKNKRAAIERTRGFGGRAMRLQGESSEMSRLVPDGSLAFLYIDADHSEAGVWRDLSYWHPKVKSGGVIALHDFQAPQYGVKQAATRFCQAHRYVLVGIPEVRSEDAGAYFYVNTTQ